MLALSFRFLAGRYHATQWGRNVNEGIIDWPPSPWRILRAIIAVWKKTSHDIEHDRVWPILESIMGEKVSFYVPKTTQSHTRHYMPFYKKGAKPTKIIDSFIVIDPQEPLVAIWDNVTLDKDQEKILDNIINKISYFGRAESWCEVCRIENPPKPNCMELKNDVSMKDKSVIQVLTPKNNTSFEELCIATADLHEKNITNLPGSQFVSYALPNDIISNSSENAKTFKPSINVIRYAIAGNVRPKITESLFVGDSLKRVTMSIYGKQNQGESSEIFSGKRNDGEYLRGNHKHAFFLPTDEDGDKILDHITVYAKNQFDQKEMMALSCMRNIYGQNGFSLVFERRGNLNDFNKVPILQESKKWRSATPFVPNRHIKARGKKGEKHIVDRPEDQIKLEISKRFDDKFRIEKIQLRGIDSVMKCGLKPIQFKRWRKNKLSGFGAYDVSIEFNENVQGPLSFGHGAHFGLGMFVPDEEDEIR